MNDRIEATPRRAAVTGAASGIGAAITRLLAEDGWRVAAIDRDEDGLRRTLAPLGDRHLALAADVGDEERMVAVFAEIAGAFGGLDGLAACAGISDGTPFFELGAATFERIHRVNTLGAFLAMREAARLMERGGRICTVSSVAGLRGGGVFGTAAYAASKGAVIALTKTAARSLAARGIGVNCVVPGPIDTAMLEPFWQNAEERARVERLIPLGRPGRADEVAETLKWLLSPASTFVTGATIVVDGGMTMH